MAMKDDEQQQGSVPATGGAEPAGAAAQKMRFNTANLKSGYANVVTATATREEVVLSFGINQNWEHPASEVEIELTHRIILNPMAAQRLLGALSKVMSDYSARYGSQSRAVAGEPSTTPH